MKNIVLTNALNVVSFFFLYIGWLGFNFPHGVMIVSINSNFPFVSIQFRFKEIQKRKKGKAEIVPWWGFAIFIANIWRKGNITSCHILAVNSEWLDSRFWASTRYFWVMEKIMGCLYIQGFSPLSLSRFFANPNFSCSWLLFLFCLCFSLSFSNYGKD